MELVAQASLTLGIEEEILASSSWLPLTESPECYRAGRSGGHLKAAHRSAVVMEPPLTWRVDLLSVCTKGAPPAEWVVGMTCTRPEHKVR